LAIDKGTKQALVGSYAEMLGKSQAVIFADFRAMPTPTLNNLRAAVRNAGGGLHAAKNTLTAIALREAGLAVPGELLVGQTITAYCFGDVSAVAKAMLDFARDNAEKFTVKGGVMGQRVLSADDVKALASLPPMEILRAQLIGMLQTPAARLIGVLSAPGGQIARALKAYADKAVEAVEAAQGAPAEAVAA